MYYDTSAVMPTNFFRYCRLVLRAAVRHAISRASFIIAIISFITGAALWLAPDFSMIVDAAAFEVMLRSQKFYAAVVVLVIIFNLICAPYWIWNDDQKIIAALREGHDAKQQRKNNNIAKLQEFYAAVDPIIESSLPMDISESDFNKYVKETETWATNCANWIEENMGRTARARFLDRTYLLAIHPHGAVNKTHTNIIRNLARWKKNLLDLIQNYDAWDGE